MRRFSPKPVPAQPVGYTLTEVLLAMAVMAITVPLILGLVVAGGESSRQAERETRAVMTARSVFEQVRLALDGNSDLIQPDDLPWGTGAANPGVGNGFFGGGGAGGDDGGDDDWLLLELDQNGRILGQADGMTYEDRWQGDDQRVVSLAAVRGFAQEVENVEVADGVALNVFRIEVRVETPARALAANRERTVFLKSDSLR